jgi:hypothetical protein
VAPSVAQVAAMPIMNVRRLQRLIDVSFSAGYGKPDDDSFAGKTRRRH